MRHVLVSLALAIVSCTAVHAAEQLGTFHQTLSKSIFSSFSAVATLPLSDGSVTIVYQSPKNSDTCADPNCIGLAHYGANGSPQWSRIKAAGLVNVVAAVIDSANRVVVTGQTPAGGPGGTDFGVLRFLPGGGDDLSFGVLGRTTIGFDLGQNNSDIPTALAIDAFNSVVVVGSVARSALNDLDFGIARLRGNNGALDAGFGTNGKAMVAFNLGPLFRFDIPYSVAIAIDSRIVVGGIANDNLIAWDLEATMGFRPVLTRLNSNGSLDTGFCNPTCNYNLYPAVHSGRRVYYFGSSQPHADNFSGVDVADNGDIVAAGTHYVENPLLTQAAIARFAASGDELSETIESGTDDYARYMSVRFANGAGTRIIAAGQSTESPNGPSNGYFVVQAFTATLGFDSSYGNCLTAHSALCFSGTGGPNHGNVAIKGLSLDALGRPLIAGNFVSLQNINLRSALFQSITNNNGPLP